MSKLSLHTNPLIASLLLKHFGGNPQRHTKQQYARTATGVSCDADSPYAACWCLMGAVYYLGLGSHQRQFSAAFSGGVMNFNDSSSFETIEARLKEIAAG